MFEDSTHGGRHQLRYTEFQDIFISTHALTEGDITSIERNIFFNIFQLTPSRRATLAAAQNTFTRRYFNSRPHGGRHVVWSCKTLQNHISTHALTEGDQSLLSVVPAKKFQLTPSRRATPWVLPGNMAVLWHFNSRPHGGRRWTGLLPGWTFHFNSRPHGGRQFVYVYCGKISSISTHALTEGDGGFVHFSGKMSISTHALTEGDRITNCHKT